MGTITHLKTGSAITEYSYDAWGRRRNATNWTYDLTGQPALFADRGFTSHEFLADFNLYNMNGRLYDPVVGRFLSPDPFIQDPSFSQSYNRYSYALNNPLKFNDPSGEINWPAIWLGNWIFGGMNNWINGGMPFKQAFSFKNNPMVASVNYHPGNNSWSNTQASAQNFVKYESIANINISTEIESVRQTYGTISAYQPDFFDRWSESSGLVSQLSYGIADGIAVTVQSLFLGSESRHLNGSQVVGNDRVDAFSVTAPMIIGGFSSLSVTAQTSTKGGLNLYKWGAEQAKKSTGWKAGDYMLYLPNKGTPKLNWKANYGYLRYEMNLGKPIFDSFRLPNGNLIPTGGFLNAERYIFCKVVVGFIIRVLEHGCHLYKINSDGI